MSLRRRIAAVAAGVLVAPLVSVALPSAPAFAHGYVSSPASRQAQCARGLVPCGDIKYEPQSVEGPKGLRSCNGGVARFAELNDNNKGWQVASTGRSVTFNWTFTARHRTANYEYYVAGRRVGFFDGGNQQPPATVSHTVNLGASGRQTVLAIWNIGDTSNAFYACIDVNAS
ncbi:lytic polysaccharide monooxygenase auxiliary activity family 9 protein [Saccharothrix sp. HUAS TT1]|uniref:lytic polysaccharide monooxygenase auxiliary activity family 9 protein n=1 Tax=unclassified Saccharothrix TaxID=2593673 RepID=UPI00345C3564